MKERCDREWPQRSFWCSLGEIWRWDHNPKQLNNQQRGSHRRLGNAHGARDDLVEASCVSFASVQARKLNHYAASPLPTKPSGFAGSPRRASEKRTVGSLGRLHHAAQSVWTHNVRPARKTGCRGWGCKQSRPLPRAVRAAKLCPRCSPSPGRELQIRRKQFQKNGVFMSENKKYYYMKLKENFFKNGCKKSAFAAYHMRGFPLM